MDNPNGKKNMGGDSGRNQNLMRILSDRPSVPDGDYVPDPDRGRRL